MYGHVHREQVESRLGQSSRYSVHPSFGSKKFVDRTIVESTGDLV